MKEVENLWLVTKRQSGEVNLTALFVESIFPNTKHLSGGRDATVSGISSLFSFPLLKASSLSDDAVSNKNQRAGTKF